MCREPFLVSQPANILRLGDCLAPKSGWQEVQIVIKRDEQASHNGVIGQSPATSDQRAQNTWSRVQG